MSIVWELIHLQFMQLKYLSPSVLINIQFTVKYTDKIYLAYKIKYFSYLPTKLLLAWATGGTTINISSPALKLKCT